MNDAVLEARDVHKNFRHGPVVLEVLQGVVLSVAPAERVAIVGASGSGKTTLLQILGGLDPPSSGVVRVAGRDIHSLSEAERGVLRNRTLGFVYQFHQLLQEFSALENVAMPLLVRRTPVAACAGHATTGRARRRADRESRRRQRRQRVRADARAQSRARHEPRGGDA